jgi:DNA-binding winged helix-turn-helix (wHTH) protein/predicted Zn-dependent protease
MTAAEKSEPPASAVCRFGVFQANLAARELRKHGIRVHLPGQPFCILSMLLEKPGEVVTREEMRQRLWAADTFVDFEHSLNTAIKKLRAALGDTPENSRYIETLPRLGYRFIAPVQQLAAVSTAAPANLEAVQSPRASTQVVTMSSLRRRPVLSIALATVLVASGMVWFWKTRRAAPFEETDSVLVSDFVNTTGDPVFDGTLKRALLVKLGESPHFNLLNEPNLRETYRLMGRSQDEKLVPPADRDVCQRAGAKVVIDGIIISLGTQYLITLEAKNCLTGGVVARQEKRALNREQVLSTLGEVIPPFRRKLGESIGTIEKFNTAIEQATTPSLAALKAYTTGDEMRLTDKEAESISFYKMAIELDPNFAIAHARLAALYRNLSQGELSRQEMKKAFELREHVSEKEKFYIAAHYYTDFTQEVEKSVQTYELWTQTYPRDWIPYNNLADAAARNGMIEKAIPAAQQALRLNPNSWFAYATLANAYMRGSRFAEARAICDRAIVENHRGSTDNTLLRTAFVQDDPATVEKELEVAKGKPNESLLLSFAAVATSGMGKLKAARLLSERAEEVALRQGLNETVSNTAYDQSLPEAEVGNISEARSLVEKGLRWNRDPASHAFAALTLARLGDTTRAEALLKNADTRPLDTLHNDVVLASVRAAIQLNRKNPRQAIEELKAAIPYDLSELSGGTTIYLRGLAYLQAGSSKDAILQFQKLIDNHGIAVSVYWPLAHLGLARAYALGGETDKALGKYREFLALWKDADADLKVLKQARSEYQKLSARGS